MKYHKGFTPIEMMIVVAIVSAVIIAVPPVIEWMRQQGVRHAVEQLRAELQLARIMAINQKHTCMIVFNIPGPNQYINSLNSQTNSLSGYRGGVRFLTKGPDGKTMASQIAFNKQGMSASIVPMDVFLADRNQLRIYRLRVMLPGSISTFVWNGDSWR